MKKIIYFLITLLILQCKSSDKQEEIRPVYIFDSDRILEVHDFKDYINGEHSDSTIVRHVFRKSFKEQKFVDTFLVGFKYKHFNLIFFDEYNLIDKVHKDTFFYKTQSYLNEIEYFDSTWLENETELDSFWTPAKCWRCSGKYDTAKIFLILPVEKTDSVLFIQVHRWYDESVD